jgi:hypothetical protein
MPLIDNFWLSIQDQLEPDLAYHQYAARIPEPPPPVHHAAAFSNPAYERFAADRILTPAASTATAGYERGGSGGGSGAARTAAPPQGHRRTPSGSSGVYYEERSGGSSGEYSDRPPPLAPRQAQFIENTRCAMRTGTTYVLYVLASLCRGNLLA